MSKSVFSFLNGSNVFVFDTETSGLPLGSPHGWGTYWDYRLNEKYESCRIVSIAWSLVEKFDKNNIDTNNILHHLRYPEGFTDIPTTHIHGISLSDALQNGKPFGYILSTYGLGIALLNSEYIVAHNVGFDYNLLLNELYRIISNNEKNVSVSINTRELAFKCLSHLQNLKTSGKIICSGEISTDICKMEFPSKINNYLGSKKAKKYKMPKLSELYKYFYGKDFENAHSADGDVKALLEIMKIM